MTPYSLVAIDTYITECILLFSAGTLATPQISLHRHTSELFFPFADPLLGLLLPPLPTQPPNLLTDNTQKWTPVSPKTVPSRHTKAGCFSC